MGVNTSINQHAMMNPDQRSLLRQPTRLLIYQQQTQGLAYVRYSVGYYNSLTCENYIANYKIFQEYQLNSRSCRQRG